MSTLNISTKVAVGWIAFLRHACKVPGFKSWPADQLRYAMALPSTSNQMPESYLKLGHYHLLPLASTSFSIQY